MSGAPVYTVGQINRYVKSVLDGDEHLRGVYVQGELSNYKMYGSGHHYFSLKDSEGVISCVMYRSAASRLNFRPENGMKVIVFGSVSAYPKDGKYQLYAEVMAADGMGDLYAAFEQLKQELSREGLFDPAHKKPLPAYPNTIAVITSPSGAAVHDMIRILNARWPLAEVKVMGVRVQGAGAARELVGAVKYANRHKVADLILLGRGGGSMEDLWAFNDPDLARAVYESEIPVISAVGHEPDVVITDYVADLRAATPSNAAELAVPDRTELLSWLNDCDSRMRTAMLRRLDVQKKRLDRCRTSRYLTDPAVYIRERELRLQTLEQRLNAAWEKGTQQRRHRLMSAAGKLDALSPLKVLSRGYSMTTDEAGRVITSSEQVQPGDLVHIQLQSGGLACTVTERSLPHGNEENI